MTLRGRFADVPGAAGEHLRAVAHEHGVLAARHTSDGTVTYGAELRGLVFRHESRQGDDADDPGESAGAAAAHAVHAWAAAHGVTVTIDRTDTTCLDDITIRRRNRRAG
ncbi:hypothetical protein AFB00_11680 [Pseudonocardia sp. HH130630-07]|nr:hypothetical protein AFB00_11680 [Pseudonocardia sp. HH130630-07]